MRFMKWRLVYLAISLAVIIPGMISLAVNGLKLSIDFTGGTLWELRLAQPFNEDTVITEDSLQTVFEESFVLSSLQPSGQNLYLLKGSEITPAQKIVAIQALQSAFAEVEEVRFEQVGPTISQELIKKTLAAVALVATLIMGYVWYQFSELRYGVSAIIAMFHDSLVLIGIFSLLGYYFGFEVDVLFVTALLTTLSFSVHDTIVVYDRIRELRKKHPRVEYEVLVDAAVIETLSRSLNNSITIILMLLSLFLLGGVTIHGFALALLVGAITGTYSSTFTAAPLLVVWDDIVKLRTKN